MSDLKGALLANRLPKSTVLIDGVGEITVRGLSRGEVLDIQQKCVKDGKPDTQLIEQHMLATGLVDPQMTVEEVQEWCAVAPSKEVAAVTEAIAELSGLTEGANREAVSTFPA